MGKGRFRDLTGATFGRLTVIERAANRNKHVYWRCQCECGNEVEVRADSLTRGPTVSCGCYHDEVVTKHGMWESSEYHIWRAMLTRCENKNMHAYDRYGGRGIKVCEDWHNFQTFYADMGAFPGSGYSLDRIDNSGDYCPENCRWATWKQQGRNRDYNRMLTYRGNQRCIAEWSEVTGISHSTLRMRLERGWTAKEALTIPVDLGNRWIRQNGV